MKEDKLDYSFNLRYLLAPGELEGGQKRATDPIWSLKVYNIERSFVKEGESILYYLKDGVTDADVSAATPKRGFVREELMIIPKDIEAPP